MSTPACCCPLPRTDCPNCGPDCHACEGERVVDRIIVDACEALNHGRRLLEVVLSPADYDAIESHFIAQWPGGVVPRDEQGRYFLSLYGKDVPITRQPVDGSPVATAAPGTGEAVPATQAPAATERHDAGAYARCSFCKRYSNDPRTLDRRAPKCECGSSDGWSGSFVAPGPDAAWSGPPPAAPAPASLRTATTAPVSAEVITESVVRWRAHAKRRTSDIGLDQALLGAFKDGMVAQREASAMEAVDYFIGPEQYAATVGVFCRWLRSHGHGDIADTARAEVTRLRGELDQQKHYTNDELQRRIKLGEEAARLRTLLEEVLDLMAYANLLDSKAGDNAVYVAWARKAREVL